MFTGDPARRDAVGHALRVSYGVERDVIEERSRPRVPCANWRSTAIAKAESLCGEVLARSEILPDDRVRIAARTVMIETNPTSST